MVDIDGSEGCEMLITCANMKASCLLLLCFVSLILQFIPSRDSGIRAPTGRVKIWLLSTWNVSGSDVATLWLVSVIQISWQVRTRARPISALVNIFRLCKTALTRFFGPFYSLARGWRPVCPTAPEKHLSWNWLMPNNTKWWWYNQQ